MSPKWRYILGTVTIVTIVGGVAYAIKKAKDAEKQAEQAISIDEARAILKENGRELTQPEETDEVELEDDETEEGLVITETTAVTVQDEPSITVVRKEVVAVAPYLEEEEDEYPDVDENVDGPILTVEPLVDFYYIEEGIDPKEDKTLRFEPNSDQAKHQYIRMELAEWVPTDDVYRILLQLFEVPFIPMNEGDEILRTQVIDYKVQFFGFKSKWNKEVSYADIIMHYARAAEFNCGETVSYWAEQFCYAAGFQSDFSEDELETMVMRLNSHTHYNAENDTYGLFGINRAYMDQAVRIATRNVDRAVTYEIEFNEMLKACMNEELKR